MSPGLLGLLGAVAIVVYLTGEATEELVERRAGGSQAAMERHHEDIALVTPIATTVVSVLALAAPAYFWHRFLPRDAHRGTTDSVSPWWTQQEA